jgi:hypothetical protein
MTIFTGSKNVADVVGVFVTGPDRLVENKNTKAELQKVTFYNAEITHIMFSHIFPTAHHVYVFGNQ